MSTTRSTLVFLCFALLLRPGQAPAQPPDPWRDTLLAAQYIDLARQYHREHRFDAEKAAAAEAVAIYNRLYGPEHPKTAHARLFVARACRDLNQEQTALELYYRSLPAFEQAQDTYWQAICHYQIGLCLRKQYRFQAVYEHSNAALALLRPDSARYAARMADVYLGIGSALNTEKRFSAAIAPLNTAMAVYTEYRDSLCIGYCGYHMGNAWFGLRDFARAKEHYLFALAHLKNRLKPGDAYFADLFVKIGLCHQKTGESEVGLRYLLEAREIYAQEGVEALDYIQFLQDLGQFYLSEQQPEQAVEHLKACLSLKEKRYGEEHFHLLTTLQLLGEACLQARRYEQAEAYYRRMLHITTASSADYTAFLFRIYSKLAELRFAQDDIDGCLRHADSAFAIVAFSLHDPREVLPRDYFRELCLLYSRALYRASKKGENSLSVLERSEQYAALAAETLYREMEEVTVNSSREILYDLDHPVLEHWLDTRMALFAITGDPRHAEAAFQIAGKSKAFLLAEAMRQNGALHFAGVPDSLIEAEQSLRERILAAEKQLDTSGFRANLHTDHHLPALNSLLTNWRNAYDALLRRIEREYPDYFQLRRPAKGISGAEIRRALAPKQALLLYSQTTAGLYAFVCTSDTLYARHLPTTPDLPFLQEQYLRALTAYHTHPAPDDALYDTLLETYISTAQALYRQLVAPIAPLLPERVLIIPDGKWWRLPFSALLTGPPADPANWRTYPFWVLGKSIGYCLSPALLLEANKPARRRATKPWLGIAPFVDMQPEDCSPDTFAPLPFSAYEVRTAAGLMQGEVWTGADATWERFLNAAHRYSVLHLATHSRADNRQGSYSFVAVSQRGPLLTAKDLFALSLDADMVVLSACEAGDGQLLRGEGIIGLVRSFLYAGARSVVASQWVAHDRSSAYLMTNFYRKWQQGAPRDGALRAAQIALLRQHPTYAHPFFWAGYRVYGNR